MRRNKVICINSELCINATDYRNYSKLDLEMVKLIKVPICLIEVEISVDFEDELAEFFYKDGSIDRSICNSPHYNLLKLYEKNGLDWIVCNVKALQYYDFFMKMNLIGEKTNLFDSSKKIKFNHTKDDILNKIRNFINLYNSIKKNGYLSGNNKGKYISILTKPLAVTRFNKRKTYESYGVFSGHHRLACLAVLGVDYADTLLLNDNLKN
jgi:hypothetical protein